jgi:hypothetical protein
MPIGTYSGNYTNTITLKSIYNPATVTATGVVNFSSAASFVPGVLGTAGVNWTLVNQGTVQSVGNAGFGVYLNGIGGTVTNSGVVQGTGRGIQIFGGTGQVLNYGTILQSGGGFGFGIRLSAGGLITNAGTINSQGTTGASSAISFGTFGVGGTLGNSPAGVITGYALGVSTDPRRAIQHDQQLRQDPEH